MKLIMFVFTLLMNTSFYEKNISNLSEDEINNILTHDPKDNLLMNLKTEKDYEIMHEKDIFCPKEMRCDFLRKDFKMCSEGYEYTVRIQFKITNSNRIIFQQYSTYNYTSNKSSKNLSIIHDHNKSRFQGQVATCSVYTFCRYIIWNCLRDSDTWTAFYISYNYTPDHPFYNKIYHNIQIIIMKSVWWHCNVKIHNEIKIYYNAFILKEKERRKCEKLLLKNLFYTFLLHTHLRLGEESPANVLCFDVLELICKQLVNEKK